MTEGVTADPALARGRLGAAVLLLALRVWAAPPEPAGGPVDIAWGVGIPLRDGVDLSATLYLPAARPDPIPAVFCLTPYIADTYHDAAIYFAGQGFAFALVDVRGRGNSGGTFVPFERDGEDGYDVAEWLAAQDWCSGRVGMWGGSYDGFTQWATAARFPPHLAAIAPASPVYPGLTFPHYRNIGNPAIVSWLALTRGATDNWRLYNDMDFWAGKVRQYHGGQAPFRHLDALLGFPSPIFQTWVQHPGLDAYWDALAPSPQDFARLDLPVLTITGYYDEGQLSPVTYFRRHHQYGGAAAARHILLIGPWDHSGTAEPALELGGLTFEEASQLDLDAVHLAFYDWALRGAARPDYLSRSVAYFAVGSGQWRQVDTLPVADDAAWLLYLDSEQGQAGSAFRSGFLAAGPPARSGPDRFTYDPLDTVGLEPPEDVYDDGWLTSQRHALHLAGDGLVYHSDPLPEAVEISGLVRLDLWLAMDVTDTDLRVELCEVDADGRSALLAMDVMRARYRESLWSARPVEPGRIEPLPLRAALLLPPADRRQSPAPDCLGSQLALVGAQLQLGRRRGRRDRRGRPASAHHPVPRPR
ncbi:MAG: CocE/NonD family hydrolase, partial [Gemmatimonadota bacterium]